MLQSTHRLILAGLIAFFVAAGVALTVVILVTRDSNGSQDSKAAAEAYCWYVSFLVGSMGWGTRYGSHVLPLGTFSVLVEMQQQYH